MLQHVPTVTDYWPRAAGPLGGARITIVGDGFSNNAAALRVEVSRIRTSFAPALPQLHASFHQLGGRSPGACLRQLSTRFAPALPSLRGSLHLLRFALPVLPPRPRAQPLAPVVPPPGPKARPLLAAQVSRTPCAVESCSLQQIVCVLAPRRSCCRHAAQSRTPCAESPRNGG